ncbi:MAG: DUF2723 domain-containing protein [Anaerolineales bacterium]|nr:DUF2723 domain-containing protein [Anaerolineales bacterium]
MPPTVHPPSTRTWLPGLLALLLLLGVYAFTLQHDVNGSAHDYTLDTGEIQVALNVWGTIHYTGYPHYTILGAALTSALRGAGVPPATAASLNSLLWTVLSLLLTYALLLRLLPGSSVLASLALIALGLVETIWLHSVIAEVYSFSFFLVALSVWLGDRLRRQWRPAEWLAAAFILGTAVAHHRVLIFLIGVVCLLCATPLLAWLRQKPARLLPSLLVFATPFLAYLYLPLRARQGAVWVYDQPQTWTGFWRQFSGSEVTGNLMRLPQSTQALLENGRFLADHLSNQLPWPAVALGLLGLLWLARAQRLVGAAALLGTAAFAGFVFLFPPAVWAPAVLMPTVLGLLLGLAYLLHRLARQRRWLRPVGWLGLGLLSLFLFQANLPFVRQLTTDPAGRDMIRRLHAIPAAPPGEPPPTVALPWGAGYFAAAYGRLVTHELDHLALVDHRANFRDLITQRNALFTPALYLSYWPPAWWESVADHPLTFHAATADVVAITPSPATHVPPPDVNFALGNGIRVRSAQLAAAANHVEVVIFWEALAPPAYDYSVAAHLVARTPVTGPQDILSQADAAHPVGGWYPTSRWQPGEIVRDVYRLPLPTGAAPAAVQLTMYRQDETGQFINQNWYVMPLREES